MNVGCGLVALVCERAAGLGPAAVGAARAAALASGSAKSSSFTVAISPVQATVGQPTTFTLTLTNSTTSSNSMGSAQVVVPAGFTDVTLGTTTSPSGWVYSLVHLDAAVHRDRQPLATACGRGSRGP